MIYSFTISLQLQNFNKIMLPQRFLISLGLVLGLSISPTLNQFSRY